MELIYLISFAIKMMLGAADNVVYNVDIPENATKVLMQSVDFEGDGKKELVVTYTSVDQIGDNNRGIRLRTNQHLDVYYLRGGVWQKMKEDWAANDNVGVEAVMSKVEVIDLGADFKEEIFYQKRFGAKSWTSRYNIYGLYDGVIEDFPIPKGYLQDISYLSDEEEARGCFQQFSRAKVEASGIREYYSVTCRVENAPMSDQPGPERGFELFLEYFPDQEFVMKMS